MIVSIVAAVGKNLELGKDNNLIWHIPDDLKYFKKLTTGKTVVMGMKTFNSIGKALPNRNNIVLSTNKIDIDGVTIINDYNDVLSLDDDEIFIIGGGTIYKLFLPMTDNLYLTEINDSCIEADTYFPSFDKKLYDKEIIEEKEFEGLNYSFVRYRKK